jgi:hypothetical protein
MACRWSIDECSPDRIAGWIDDNGPVDAIDIAVNGRRIATLSPTDYREDLEDAGIGDGRRSFVFVISGHLVEPVNLVSISRGEQVLHSATMRSPRSIANDAPPPASQAVALATDRAALLKGAVRRVYKEVTQQEACDFYHVADLPDGTTTRGAWDLRSTVDQYLGNIGFAGKRVIEIGPASGFLSFHMERRGARVAVVEPPMESFWDLVPQAAVDLAETRKAFGAHIERIRNSFWYLHGCFGSKVESYEVDAYRIPPQPTKFDIGLIASVLLHVSSPVKMLESVAAVVDQIIIVEQYIDELADHPVCWLAPSAANRTVDKWWDFSPKFFEQYLAVLGFPHTVVTRHRQLFAVTNEWSELFTIVGSR